MTKATDAPDRSPAVFVLGAGEVAVRAARYASETDGVARVVIGGRHLERVQAVAGQSGISCSAREWRPGMPMPAEVAAVACTLPGEAAVAAARASIEAGLPFVSCADGDETIAALLDLHEDAARAGVPLVVGAGFAPGLAEVLAVHAEGALDEADEVRVARTGLAGPACQRALAAARSGSVEDWVEGAWRRERGGTVPTLVWFPEPVGGVDCGRAALGDTRLLVRCLESVRTARTSAGAVPGTGGVLGMLPVRLPVPQLRPWTLDSSGWAGVWVEVRGSVEGRRASVVYGSVDRMASAAGAVLALVAAWLAGAGLPFGERPAAGACGVAEVVDPPAFLGELAARGVRAACFEGAGAS